MTHALLQKWLGLPAGPWPPDGRTLLGLPPGPADPFVVETLALQRMEKLRPFQLVYPDLVTEGMNRLAQAMVTLVSEPPEAPATLDMPAAPPARPAPSRKYQTRPVSPRFEAIDLALPADSGGVAPPPAPLIAPTAPEIMDAEVVEAEVVAAPAAPAPRRRAVPPLTFRIPAAVPYELPADRREAYRELAALRQLRRAWRRLRPAIADPGEPLRGVAEVCGFLEALLEARAAMRRQGFDPAGLGGAGELVRALLGQRQALTVFRSLLPDQRRRLAADWAAGWAAVEARSGSIRRALGARRAERPSSARRRLLLRLRAPEAVPAALTLLALLAGAARTLSR